MKKYFLLFAIIISMASDSQVTRVFFQASGLTCSMCSNSINKSLRTLDFVDKITADVRNYTFEVSFKDGSNVDFDRIKKKVEDAGFSIGDFKATIYLSNNQLAGDQTIKIGTSTLLIVNGKDQTLHGDIIVRFLDRGFVSSKEYKASSISKSSTEAGNYHVRI